MLTSINLTGELFYAARSKKFHVRQKVFRLKMENKKVPLNEIFKCHRTTPYEPQKTINKLQLMLIKSPLICIQKKCDVI